MRSLNPGDSSSGDFKLKVLCIIKKIALHIRLSNSVNNCWNPCAGMGGSHWDWLFSIQWNSWKPETHLDVPRHKMTRCLAISSCVTILMTGNKSQIWQIHQASLSSAPRIRRHVFHLSNVCISHVGEMLVWWYHIDVSRNNDFICKKTLVIITRRFITVITTDLNRSGCCNSSHS